LAAAAEVAAALVAQVLPEAGQPVLAQPRLLAQLRQEAELLVPAQPRIRVLLVLARLPVVVVEPEVLLHLRSRQSFSAAMGRSSP
jgi:hypothetical protein